MSEKFFAWCNLDKWKKSDLPMPAMVQVCVGTHSSHVDGTIALTAELANDAEVDYWIDSLIEDLNQVRSEAKRKIKDKNEMVRSSSKNP
ncbi:MAG: hypothetical protein ACT4PZ_21010 [Panacagrimonas sp.]